MTSSAPPSNATTRSKTLGCGELSSCRSSLRTANPDGCWLMAGGGQRAASGLPWPSIRHQPFDRLLRAERMFFRLGPGNHIAHGRLAGERPLNRLFRRLVVVVEDLRVVARIPVDEHADHDAQVVGLVLRDDAALDRVDHG